MHASRKHDVAPIACCLSLPYRPQGRRYAMTAIDQCLAAFLFSVEGIIHKRFGARPGRAFTTSIPGHRRFLGLLCKRLRLLGEWYRRLCKLLGLLESMHKLRLGRFQQLVHRHCHHVRADMGA